MNRQKAKVLRMTLENILEEAKAKLEALGVAASLGNARYSDTDCTFKLELANVGEDGVAQTAEVTDFKTSATLYGLEAGDLGKIFLHPSGRRFKITGCKPRSRKYPICADEVATGKQCKFPASTVLVGLKLAAVQESMNKL